jgi:transglutaminase-like putative cysteine protease
MKLIVSMLAALVLLLPQSSLAQSYQKYSWDSSPTLSVLKGKQAQEPEITLLRHAQYEFLFDAGNNPVIYYTHHEKTRVNNDKAVSANNRIYIPMYRVQELVEVKARTIHPGNRVVEINKADIKEVEDKEAGAGYKIFAIDGAEVGSEIEFYYTCRMSPKFFGREYFQFESPLKKGSFTLISPPNLRFEFKSYNGFSEVKKQEGNEEKNVYTAAIEEVPALKTEAFSAYNDNRKRVEFKLTYNSVGGFVKLFTWESAGKNVYENMHNLDKQEDKEAAKILKSIKTEQYATTALKAAAIEDWVKTKYYINNNAEGGDNIAFIAKNKFGSKSGHTRLMVSLLEKAGIPLELVLTTNRRDVKMDGAFESFNYLEEYLIYLPSEEKFIAPYMPQYRLDMTPPQFTANWGLFIRSKVVRDYVHPISEIKYIPAPKSADNHDNMIVAVDFSDDLSATTIRLDRSFKGYQASYIKSALPMLEESRRQELLKDLVKFMSQDSDIQEMKFEKTDVNFQTFQEPLVVNSLFKSSAFVDRAGATVLFKVGELIGPQSELYQEEKRMMPVENEYNRSYLRTITVNIPEGYEIQNLKDLVIKANAKDEKQEVVYSFISDYTLEANRLTIAVTEFYESVYYPLDKFEDFRKVINAAADFNKIVLVMKKAKQG